MNFLRKYPLFLVLLPAFFCLHGAAENFGAIRMDSVVILAGVILISLSILFLLLQLVIKNNAISSVTSFYIALWYLFFGAIHDWVKELAFLGWFQKYSVILPFLLLSTFALVIILKKKKLKLANLYLFLNILLVIYCSIDIFSIAKKSMQVNKLSIGHRIPFDKKLVKLKPNVYFMLFDGYPGYKSLKDSFSFANDSLYQTLEKKGFAILPTFSNYDYTYFSMASLFNMEYVDQKGNKPITMDDLNIRSMEIKYGSVFSIFESMNYTVKNYSLFDVNHNPGLGYSFALNIGNFQLITDKMLHARFIKNVGWVFTTGKFAIPFFKKQYDSETDRYNKKVESSFDNYWLKSNTNPQFVYLHFLMPHWPYYFDENGNPDKAASMFDETAYYDKIKFLSYLKYTNQKIEKYINQILQNDPEAIIICMSDHGFREYKTEKNSTSPAVYDNICAFRFPDKKDRGYKEKWSTVNLFRYLFNTEYGQNIPYLEDSTVNLKH